MTFPVTTIKACRDHREEADRLMQETLQSGTACITLRVGKKLCEFCPREIPPHRRQ